ncbi:alpha/beta hydrolase [Corynebacterium sanguinis]|uniref:alpha/beta hydrolase n=1 Tax=Corynebacterium sanguinis TaxID=2594913 RepID=UPI0021A8D675|nr:alpha/beta hydrolase [Corynebacterium sanguinis]MCT2252843.1 alpha/beta hydrolase [Corynebacterium sanguinis]
MTSKLEQGSLDDDYPINDQSNPDFNVGGVKRTLPDELQLEQIVSYMDATYPRPSDAGELDRYLALLPDRLTHAAMLMLGSAVDHAMPGVAFAGEVGLESTEFGPLLRPSHSSGVWVVARTPLGPRAREFAWQPEVAGAAELSGAVILDVDGRELVEPAIEFARSQGAAEVVAWLHLDVFATSADRTIVSFPRASSHAPEGALVQVPRGTGPGREYFSTGEISTPAEARRRISDVADFLTSGPAS